METVGITVEALPIVLDAIDNYHRCLLVPPASKNHETYKAAVEGIHRDLFIQKQQLQFTLEGIGLQSDPTTEQTIQRIHELHPESYDEAMRILRHMDDTLVRLMDRLDIDSSGKVCKNSMWEYCNQSKDV